MGFLALFRPTNLADGVRISGRNPGISKHIVDVVQITLQARCHIIIAMDMLVYIATDIQHPIAAYGNILIILLPFGKELRKKVIGHIANAEGSTRHSHV
ncbi:hypothetical protein NBRC106471_1878 [Acetobacter pasteurianus subsp. pasteurianus LMG 1262 = NBRC 106471]|nr:hypothetical protein NBRC106471_1878 [Acetobacter pasteurianus subsp. pasteurianus LMG 1262 = NBRC 106471]